jgi:hypothetical protein
MGAALLVRRTGIDADLRPPDFHRFKIPGERLCPADGGMVVQLQAGIGAPVPIVFSDMDFILLHGALASMANAGILPAMTGAGFNIDSVLRFFCGHVTAIHR